MVVDVELFNVKFTSRSSKINLEPSSLNLDLDHVNGFVMMTDIFVVTTMDMLHLRTHLQVGGHSYLHHESHGREREREKERERERERENKDTRHIFNM